MTKCDAVAKFVEFYENFDLTDRRAFDSVYSTEIQFIDPFHSIQGNLSVYQYFRNLMSNVPECRFAITDVFYADTHGHAVVFWDMYYRHKRLNGGKEIKVTGCSHLKYEDRIVFHQDYFDSSQMLYRNIPLVGSVIRFIEGRI